MLDFLFVNHPEPPLHKKIGVRERGIDDQRVDCSKYMYKHACVYIHIYFSLSLPTSIPSLYEIL